MNRLEYNKKREKGKHLTLEENLLWSLIKGIGVREWTFKKRIKGWKSIF